MSIAAYCRLEFVLVIETVAKDRILALFVMHNKGKRCTVVILLTTFITIPPNSHIQGYSAYYKYSVCVHVCACISHSVLCHNYSEV